MNPATDNTPRPTANPVPVVGVPVPTVFFLNFIGCTVVALVLWLLVPVIGQFGFFKVFLHSQAIGNTISALIVLLTWGAQSAQFTSQWIKPVIIGIATPIGAYVGMSIARSLLGVPSGPMVFLSEPGQLMATLITTLIVTVVFTAYLSSREKLIRLKLQASEESRRADNARFAMLQAQVEPHMLFNTLANLRALIGTDTDRALAMLDRLDSFLRETLTSSQKGAATLGHEFSVIENYLELMRVRMGNRLNYSLNLADNCRHLKVPPLLLQPLVENAIRHGIEPNINGGKIAVSAAILGNQLTLVVADTDASLDLPRPATDLSLVTDLPAGFGLRNLAQRLQQSFGDDATMEFRSTPKDRTQDRPTESPCGKLSTCAMPGTCVTIRLPANGM